jgi:hypothetical protein
MRTPDPAIHRRGWTEDLFRCEVTAGAIDFGDAGPRRRAAQARPVRVRQRPPSSQDVQREYSFITKHLRDFYREKELEAMSNKQKMHNTPPGRFLIYNNLDFIVSASYQGNSKRGT